MVQRYVDRGYTRKSAAQYVRGEIDVEQLQLENGDKAKLSAKESVELVDATERWEALIRAGNDPQTVIDLIEGRITLAEFIDKNQDVIMTPTTPDEPIESEGDTELKEPGEYYDPDPEDYATPRDEKETPADKTRKRKRDENNDLAVKTIASELNISEAEAEQKLVSGDLSRSLRCKIQNKIDDKIKNKQEEK